MGQDNAGEAGAQRRSNSNVRNSGGSDGNKRVSKKAKANPKTAAAKEELKKSNIYGAKGEQTELDQFDGYQKLGKIPASKLVGGRDGDYGVESSKLMKSKLRAEVESLSLKLDDPNGVSEQAEIYHFDYEKALHHYVAWEDKDGKRVIMQSKIRE